jgi:hypothetical protein
MLFTPAEKVLSLPSSSRGSRCGGSALARRGFLRSAGAWTGWKLGISPRVHLEMDTATSVPFETWGETWSGFSAGLVHIVFAGAPRRALSEWAKATGERSVYK